MKKRRTALVSSILALLLCVSMLMGTTLAWFTDGVSSQHNQILAGSLDVELEQYVDGKWVRVNESTNVFEKDTLWEPGHTEVVYLRIVNAGDLALKYGFGVNVAKETGSVNVEGENFKLSDHIRYGIILSDSQVTYADRYTARAALQTSQLINQAYTSDAGALYPVDNTQNLPSEKYVTMVVYMPEEVGNEANYATGAAIPTIELGLRLMATQEVHESDSFGSDYDASAEIPSFNFPDNVFNDDVTVPVEKDNEGKVSSPVTLQGNRTTAEVPAGVLLADGVDALNLTTGNVGQSQANLILGENESQRSVDVHIGGVSADNTVPMTIIMHEVAPKGLNMGNYKLYHVENGQTVEMTYVASDAAFTAHNQFKYDPATGDMVLYMATFSEVALVADTINPWNGDVDHTWYDADADTLTIASADQLWSFSQLVGGMAKNENGTYLLTDEDGQPARDSFYGKTIKLITDINLADDEEHNVEGKIFYPIGYNSNDGKYEKTHTAISSSLKTFEGTFDGQGHIIANFYHNTWEMKGDHDWYAPEEQYYRDGMGLFGRVYGGTVKNLTVSNFSSDGEIATTGTIAAYADCGATFENIAIFNCNPRVYNIGNGGIVGCVGWYAKEADTKVTFRNITVDKSNKISALWGSYDVACGGIVGQYYPTSGQSSANYPVNGGIDLINCHVAAQMDVYNDVCGNYQYYAYRYAGMMIGSIRENETIDGHVYPKMNGITASDCTVHYDTWNDYYYCELQKNGKASYTHDNKFSRLEQVAKVEGTTITYLDGSTDTVPASGWANYVVVTGKHATENANCFHFKDGQVWNHANAGIQTGVDENGDNQDDLVEDKQHIYLPFSQLFTGYGWGVTSKGLADYEGVETMDISYTEQENSVEKFKVKAELPEIKNGTAVKVGDLFAYDAACGVELKPESIQVAVTGLNNSGIVAEYSANSTDWTKGTLTFSGVENGLCTVTIQDYYFCKPTTIVLRNGVVSQVEKFGVVFPNTATYLYRVGNLNEISLVSLFKETGEIAVNDANVEITVKDQEGKYTFKPDSGEWTKGKLDFNNDFTGVVEIVISENNAFQKSLKVEVVEARNAISAEGTKDKNGNLSNVVLLNNVGFGTIDVYGGYTLYGNGFTMTASADAVAKQMDYGFVVLENGTLDNVQIVCPNFSHSILYDSNKSEGGNTSDGQGRYNNIRSAVVMKGDSTITNSYVSGGRAAVYVCSGIATINNSTIVGGAAANIDIAVVNSVLLKDLTLIQKPFQATVNNLNKTLMGMSVIVHCDSDGSTADIRLEGNLKQYAWINADDAQYVPTVATGIVNNALGKTDFLHDLDGDKENESLNLGFVFMPAETNGTRTPTIKEKDYRTNKATVPYDYVEVKGATAATVYSYKNTEGTADEYLTEPGYTPNMQESTSPMISYVGALNGCNFATTHDDANGWSSTLTVDLDTIGSFDFLFDNLIAMKHGQKLEYTVTDANGNAVNKANPVQLTSSVEHRYTLSIVDDLQFNADGEKIEGGAVTHKYSFVLIATMSKIDPPVLTINAADALPIAKQYKNDDWTIAVPALENITVTYWSTTDKAYKKDVSLSTLIDWNRITVGKQAASGTNGNVWTYEGPDFVLEITGGTVKSNPAVYTIPVVVNRNNTKQLYFVAANSSDGMVSNGTAARETTMSFKFTDKNQTTGTGSRYWKVEYASQIKDKTQYVYGDFCKGTLTTAGDNPGCVTPDTLVTLADGSQKRIDQVTYEDQLLVWDFFKGEYTAMPSIVVRNHGYDTYRVLTLNFSDGTMVDVIAEHGFFDVGTNEFIMISENNVAEFVGHSFVKGNNKMSTVKLVDYSVREEYTAAYSILTAVHYNCVLADMLTLTPNVIGGNYFMPFEVGEDMKFDEVKMQADIEKYGLFTYEEFADYVTAEQFYALNAPQVKVAVGKGIITMEQLYQIIEELIPHE